MVIFKGDDTGGNFGKRLFFRVHSRYDLAGCVIVFNYQGFTRRYEGVGDGDTIEIFFSHNETARMSVGTFKAVIFSVDSSGKYRTIENGIPIRVTTDLRECYGDNTMDVTVGNAIDWDSILHKPFEGVEVDLSTDDGKLAALGTVIEKLGGTVKASLFAAALAALSAFGYEPPANTNSFDRSGVTYAQRGGMGNATYVVTNVATRYAPVTLPKHLRVVDFADAYEEDAEWFYERYDAQAGGCSSFKVGNFYGRNFDWPLEDAVQFVVRMSPTDGRLASVGIASVGTNLSSAVVQSGENSRFYKALAGMTSGGMNAEGVFANMNVVPYRAGGWTGAENGFGAVRHVLDNCASAYEAANWIAANAAVPEALRKRGFSMQFMVGDAASVYIVQDGVVRGNGGDVLTNFRIFDQLGGVHYQRFDIGQYDPYGTGLERFDGLRAFVSSAGAGATLGGCKAALEGAWFAKAYENDFQRPTEFAGATEGLTLLSSDTELRNWARAHVPTERRYGDGTWQTCHSAVYDIANRVVYVAVDETSDWYAFGMLGSGNGNGKVKSVNGQVGDVVITAQGLGALTPEATNAIDHVKSGELRINADGTARMQVGWNYGEWLPPETPHQGHEEYYGDVSFENGRWRCWHSVWNDEDEPASWDGWWEDMVGDIHNENALELSFPDGMRTAVGRKIEDTKLVNTNGLADALSEKVSKTGYQKFTNGLYWDFTDEATMHFYDSWIEFTNDDDEESSTGILFEDGSLIFMENNSRIEIENGGYMDVGAGAYAIFGDTESLRFRYGAGYENIDERIERVAGSDFTNWRNAENVIAGRNARLLDASRTGDVIIGNDAKASSFYSVAIGYGATVTNTTSIAIGSGARSHGQRTFNVAADIGRWYAGDVPVVQAMTHNFVQTGLDPETGNPIYELDMADPVIHKKEVHVVNVVKDIFDHGLDANWRLTVTDGDLTMVVTTNEDMAAYVEANAVLTDQRTEHLWRLAVDAGDLKFSTNGEKGK